MFSIATGENDDGWTWRHLGDKFHKTPASEPGEVRIAEVHDHNVRMQTPDFLHSRILKAAVEAGKDVYCEKPMGTKLDEAKALAREAEENLRAAGLNLRLLETGARREDRQAAQSNVAAARAELSKSTSRLKEIDLLQAEQKVARAELDLALAQRTKAAADLEETRILAPADGVVARVHTKSGQVVRAGQAIITLNLLVGNVDWVGGLAVGGGHWHEDGSKGGPFPKNVVVGAPGAIPHFGIYLSRERIRYEDTTLFQQDGYPAQRLWYPFSDEVYQEVIPSAGDGYPYPVKAMLIQKGTPVLSCPAGDKQISDRKSTRLNSSHTDISRMPSSA